MGEGLSFSFEGRHEGLPNREEQLRFREALLERLRESLENTPEVTPGSLLDKLIAIHIEASLERDPYKRKQLGRYIHDILSAIAAEKWVMLSKIEQEQYLIFLEQQADAADRDYLRFFENDIDRQEFYRRLPDGIREDSGMILKAFTPEAIKPEQTN